MGWGGSRGLQACTVSDRPCVCLPGFHCIRGSAALPPVQQRPALWLKTLVDFPSPQRRGVGADHLPNPPISVPHPCVTRLPTGSTPPPRGRNLPPIQNTKTLELEKEFLFNMYLTLGPQAMVVARTAQPYGEAGQDLVPEPQDEENQQGPSERRVMRLEFVKE